MAIDISQFKTTNALTDFSLRSANDMKSFVADEVLTPAYVPKKQFKKYQYDLSNYRLTNGKASSKAEAVKVDYGVFTSSAEADLYKYSADVDPQDARDSDDVVADNDQDAALTCMERALIQKESVVMTKITTAANYPSSLKATLASGSRWSDVGGDPVGDIKTGKLAVRGICGRMPNALLTTVEGLEALKINEALKDRVKYTSAQALTEDIIKNLLGIDELIVAKAQYNGNMEGNATQSLSNILGNFAVLFVKDSNQMRRTVCLGRTFYVTGGGSASQPGGFYTYKYVDNKRGSAAGRVEVIEVGMEYAADFATVDSQSSGKVGAGYLLTTPV